MKRIPLQAGRGRSVCVDRAMQAFFKRVERGGKPGYPRYRSGHRYQVLEVAEAMAGMLKCSLDGRRERRLRRRVARAQRGSESRRKKVMSLSRETYRNQVRNRNICHRASTRLVGRFGRIAVEDLRIRNMTRSAAGTAEEPGKNVAQKSGLNRS